MGIATLPMVVDNLELNLLRLQNARLLTENVQLRTQADWSGTIRQNMTNWVRLTPGDHLLKKECLSWLLRWDEKMHKTQQGKTARPATPEPSREPLWRTSACWLPVA